MTKREIIINTINHKSTGVVPYQLDLTNDVRERLIRETEDVNFERNAGSYMVMERNESFTVVSPNNAEHITVFVWRKDQEGDFGTVDVYQLTEASFGDYTFPAPDEALIREKCERLVSTENTDLFKCYIIGFSLFERAWSLRGMENILTDFILEPEFANELLDRIVEYNLAVMDIVMEYPVDCIYFGDDWGQQKGLIMGPNHWREFIKPRLARMYNHAKERELFVFQHSCGDIEEVFGDLIEIGLDVYNTFQPEIYNIRKIKREFGDKLTFYGGISTQHVLPHGTADDVRAAVRETVEIMSVNGGYIIAPTHSIPNDVPTENIMAFLEVARNYLELFPDVL